MLLPDAVGSAAHPHLMVGGGKEGIIFLVDRDNLGTYSATTDRDVQEFDAGRAVFSARRPILIIRSIIRALAAS